MAHLVLAAIRLVWSASRREFVTVVVMDVLQGVGVFILILQVQKLRAGLIAWGDESASSLAFGVAGFVAANILISVAEAVIANRRQLLADDRSRTYLFELLTGREPAKEIRAFKAGGAYLPLDSDQPAEAAGALSAGAMVEFSVGGGDSGPA